ncbi:MAG: MerR family transcriptional regulator [Ktedonobacteraceae bacterium]|nr:MerR family transcriptional regulator [Ktedonobacteraceae bacterium]
MTNTPEQPEIDSSQKQLSYSIEQVASRTGLTKRTLRYYEEVGLLPPTDRTGGNYRRYSEADIQILERVKELRDLLGFSLSEIRELLDVEEERGQIKLAFRQETDAEAKIAQLERSDELIHRQLELVDQKINGLQQMRATLLARLERHKLKRQELRNSPTS